MSRIRAGPFPAGLIDKPFATCRSLFGPTSLISEIQLIASGIRLLDIAGLLRCRP
jgi:hypothetical protein